MNWSQLRINWSQLRTNNPFYLNSDSDSDPDRTDSERRDGHTPEMIAFWMERDAFSFDKLDWFHTIELRPKYARVSFFSSFSQLEPGKIRPLVTQTGVPTKDIIFYNCELFVRSITIIKFDFLPRKHKNS